VVITHRTASDLISTGLITSPPGAVQSIAMSMYVCLSVCLFARIIRKPHTAELHLHQILFNMLPVSAAWSSLVAL